MIHRENRISLVVLTETREAFMQQHPLEFFIGAVGSITGFYIFCISKILIKVKSIGKLILYRVRE